MVNEGVTDAELRKAKNIKLAEFWRAMKTIDGKARAIGEYETFFGDYRKLFEAPEAYEAVTKDDVKRVAAKYFRSTNRTVGVLEPQTAAAATPETAR